MHAWYPHTGQKRELELQMAESCHIDTGNQTWVISGSSHCSCIFETAVLGSKLKESADVLNCKSSPFSVSQQGDVCSSRGVLVAFAVYSLFLVSHVICADV